MHLYSVVQCLFSSHLLAITFDWHLFWPVEVNRPQMIYNKAGPRVVWTLYDRSGLCESATECLSQRVSSLFPAQPQSWDRYVHTFHFVVPTAVKNAPDPRAHVLGDFFYFALKGAAVTNAPCTVSFMLLDIMKFHTTWLDVRVGSAKHILYHVCP